MIEYFVMDESHVRQVAELERQCFADPWSEHSVCSELTNPLSLWVVACEDGSVVGYVGSQSVMGEADMMNLAVASQCRRRNIGCQLVSQLEERLRQKGVHSMTLEVRQSNESAIALYQKLGYAQVGLRRNYYHNPKEDALILKKEW